MIQVVFRLASEKILVTIDGETIKFANTSQGMQESTIENLQLSKPGVVKEFPDLKDNENWRKEAINRFKKHIKSLKTEDERVNYLIEDLKKHGYIAEAKQKKGFRVEKIK